MENEEIQEQVSHFPTAPTLYSNKKGEQQHPVGCANLQAHFTIGTYWVNALQITSSRQR